MARGGSASSYSSFQCSTWSFALQKSSSYIESGLCFHKLLEFIILYPLLFPGYVDFFSPHIARQMLTLYVSMPGFGIKEWRSHMIEQSKEKKTKQNQQKQQTTLHKPNRNKKTQTHKLHYKNEHYQNACC